MKTYAETSTTFEGSSKTIESSSAAIEHPSFQLPPRFTVMNIHAPLKALFDHGHSCKTEATNPNFESIHVNAQTQCSKACNLSKDTNSTASNPRVSMGSIPKEFSEDTIHQMHGNIELDNQRNESNTLDEDETLNKHVFP
jgi:hypothetical protein